MTARKSMAWWWLTFVQWFCWTTLVWLILKTTGCQVFGQEVRPGGARLVPVHSLPQQGCVLQPVAGRKCCPPNCRCPETCRCGCKEYSGSPSAGSIFREPETPQPRLDADPPVLPAKPMQQPVEDPRIAQLEAEVRELRALIANIRSGPPGPPGPTGAMGPMGLPGKPATIDVDQLSAAVIERLPPFYYQVIDERGATEPAPVRPGDLMRISFERSSIQSIDPSLGVP